MKVNELISYLEHLIPVQLQDSYDNCGIQVGATDLEITGVLTCLDVTEAVIDEAIAENCNVVVAHHPLLFSGLKSITGKSYVERTVIKAIQNNICIYAMHTNLDHVNFGVNKKIGDKLGILNPQVLSPKSGNLVKFIVYVPRESLEQVKQAIFNAGGGEIGNYSECSFSTEGVGTFKPNELANPTIGKSNVQEQVNEYKLEVILPNYLQHIVLNAVQNAHPYEEVAHEFIALNNSNQTIGAGMIGSYNEPILVEDWLAMVKQNFKAGVIRFTVPTQKEIKTVAWCGGSGSFLLPNAIGKKADVFLSSDFKYHQFFDAENKIMIADIGHYEAEQFTCEIIADIISKKFHNFAVRICRTNTNPINYY